VTVGTLQQMIDTLEAEAADSVRSFEDIDLPLRALLEQKALSLCHFNEMRTRVVDINQGPAVPLMEGRFSGIEHAMSNVLQQARALAFVRRLLHGLRDHEAEMRREAFK